MKSQQKSLPVRSRKATAHRAHQKPAGTTFPRSGGLASAANQQLLLFRCRRATIAAEMWWLKCYPANPQIMKRLAQLRVNAHLLMLDVTRWMERNAALILISAFCFLLFILGTGCSPAWQFHPGKPGGDW